METGTREIGIGEAERRRSKGRSKEKEGRKGRKEESKERKMMEVKE